MIKLKDILESRLVESTERPYQGYLDLGLGGKSAKITIGGHPTMGKIPPNQYYIIEFPDKPIRIDVDKDNVVQFMQPFGTQVLGNHKQTFDPPIYLRGEVIWKSYSKGPTGAREGDFITLHGEISYDWPGVTIDPKNFAIGTNAALTSFFKQKAEEWLAANPEQKPKPDPSRPYQGGTECK